jgi:integrase
MAIYKPKYRDPKTNEWVSSGTWWYEFVFAGKRIRESANTTRKTIAQDAEKKRRLELERAMAGLPVEDKGQRIASVKDMTVPYLKRYRVNHRTSAATFGNCCINNLNRHLGSVLLPDLTEKRIVGYMEKRLAEGAAGRTINAELGELARAMGRTWKVLWPRVKKLEERHDIGRALSSAEEQALMDAADRLASGKVKKDFKRGGKVHEQSIGPRGIMLPTMIRLALLTGMRAEELTSLRWGQVNLETKTFTIGKAKTAAGTGRMIPMGATVYAAMVKHLAWWSESFGQAASDLCVFPFGNPPSDPSRPVTTLKHSWESVREEAGITCRWHDLRHSFCTKLAEQGVPESTMLALMGHMSRAMLERYSHIRMAAKRDAVESLTVGTTPAPKNGVPKDSPKETKRAALRQPVIH